MKLRLFRSLSAWLPLVILANLFIASMLLVTPIYAQQLETKTIKVEPLVKQINRTGKLTFKRTLHLSFKTNGYLKALNIDEGDSFLKGQVLAQLDTAELRAEKNASYARLVQAKREVKRINTLLSKKLSSQQALEEAKTLVETTRASHNVAEYNLIKAQLIAPFDGVVLTRFSELGELQSPNKSTLLLAAVDNNLVVRVALTATEMAVMHLQQEIAINLADMGSITGIVSKLPIIANQQSHLFTIEILLVDLKATETIVGQLAHVSTEVITDKFAYRLPITALNSVDNQGRALIMLQDASASAPDKFSQQAFEIKQLSNQYIYLAAQVNSPPLTVVTLGWQQLALPKAKPINEVN